MKVIAKIRPILPKKHYENIRKYYRFLRACFYYGKRYECPFCGKTFRKMLSEGADIPAWDKEKIIGRRRHNARCPACSANDREKLVYLYLLHKTRLLGADRVRILHVAPEENLGEKLSSLKNVDYLSADINPRAADVKMDVANIQYDDNDFDMIICNHVLEHAADDIKAMSELFRVLKPKGLAILQTPLSTELKSTYEDPDIIDPTERALKFGQSDHVRLYALNDYTKRLRNVGFKTLVFKWSDDPEFSSMAEKFALNKEEPVIQARKY